MPDQIPCPRPCCKVPRFVIAFGMSPRQFAGSIVLAMVLALPMAAVLRACLG